MARFGKGIFDKAGVLMHKKSETAEMTTPLRHARDRVVGAVVFVLGRLCRLRLRHILTRRGGLRVRVVAMPFAIVFAALFSLGSFSSDTRAYSVNEMTLVDKIGSERLISAHQVPGTAVVEEAPVAARPDKKLALAMAQPPEKIALPEPKPKEKSMTIGKGDTLAAVLQKAGLSGGEAYKTVEAASEHFDPRKIRPGQAVHVRFDPAGDGYRFAEMKLALDPVRAVVVSKKEDGGELDAGLFEKPVKEQFRSGTATIETSLYGSAARAGIPSHVIAETIRVYSWDVDFQRDIRQGDSLEVLYSVIETEDGEFVRYGDIYYADLAVGGKSKPVYRFEMKGGDVDYFEADGRSVRKALMKTPVDGARISSGFGMRKHPVLGYSKMHKGMDFAAPTGTPIYAAGDGVVEKAGRWSSFGNYVRIRHNAGLKTAYAHLNKIGKGISPGVRVKQGQVIGTVGTTGRSTGPHLHYEVHVNGRQVNPATVKLPKGETLTGTELAAFKAQAKKMDQQYALISGNAKFAQAGQVEQ